MRPWHPILLTVFFCLTYYAVTVAQAAPLFDEARFVTLNAEPKTIKAWRGKVAIVNFWATWCGPCKEEIPMLNSLRKELAPRGIEVVGIALDNKIEVNNFIKKWAIHYPVLLGDSDTLSLLRQLGNPSSALPFTLVLDRQGNIVATLAGKLAEKTLRDTIEKYL